MRRLPLLALLLLTALPLRAEETAPACVPPGVWADGTGRRQETAPLLRRVAEQPAVLLGEQHDKAEHHRWQLHALAGLHALNPDLAVGLEMMPRRLQPLLDRWSAGGLDEATFLKESDWRNVWGFDPAFYMPILHFARMHRLPVVGLNVERTLISRIAREGWSAVPEADREGVGTPAPPTAAYRERLLETLAAHNRPDSPPEAAERFIEAQSIWDRAMAERIADTRRATGRGVVAILGAGHAEQRNGVPHQLADLGIPDSAVLLPWDADRPCADLDGRVADAVFGLGPSKEPAEPPRPRLGVQLDPAPDGVRIGSVLDNSVAAAAGLAAGDRLVSAAGSPIRKPADLTAIVQRQAPGTWLPITVRRGEATRDVVAKFPAE
ncbi:putative iron-regulated protein [Azospirillum agricola]|uniref:ChaN family lipoprotein n=1 Tax=Azospirillum agricola TaxID=1720247 RepID=UPI002D804A4A|nr:ChaN family lipoprotein [Azospirillum agricola]MBP2230300.1 putative iron-regulated protein [Azospirillum agricola]